MNGNGQKTDMVIRQPLLSQYSENSLHRRLTVQQALCKWYRVLKEGTCLKDSGEIIFENFENTGILKSLQADLGMIPELLMDELINNDTISDKGQYIRLVQALLVNLSDILPESEIREQLLNEADSLLEFMQNFLYQYFDFDFRIPVHHVKHLQDRTNLKLDYWKIKLINSSLIDVLREIINTSIVRLENYLTFRKVSYLNNIFRQIESSTYIIHEAYIRELLLSNNFNAASFIDYEVNLIKNKLTDGNTMAENIALLEAEQLQVIQLKDRPDSGYELNRPSVKMQLNEWIIEKIKQVELAILKGKDKDLQIDPESKIQTSLSVAKLAVLIRLLVADKIIINKSIAPMLRTVAKLFTTLQKDDVSFGSLETKYHAPDKATLNMMREMLQKWVSLTGKL